MLSAITLMLISHIAFWNIQIGFPVTYAFLGAAPETTYPGRAPIVQTLFFYPFGTDGILNETGTPAESSSPYFWLNSGGVLTIEDGVGKTAQGALGNANVWRLLYNTNNAVDTERGYLPQNIFRLITKGRWENLDQSLRVKIIRLNMANTPNRDGYSGIFLMSRYRDGNNLYYAGIRMDGDAVIKKKYQGTYTTLAQTPVWNADTAFNRDTNPSLIPSNTWMGIRSLVYTHEDGIVRIELWLDRNDDGVWERTLVVDDTNNPIITGGQTGIRGDYLDLWFDNYVIEEWNSSR